MNATAEEFDLRELLESEGADFSRGKRPRCPRCGKQGTLAVDFGRGVYCCHYVACTFRGNARQLARAQERLQQITPAENRKRNQAYAEARHGAAWLERRIGARRLELYEAHRSLLRIVDGASHRLGADPDSETAWGALAWVYSQLPHVRAELAILEEAPACRLLRFLTASEEERATHIGQVLLIGGVASWDGKFVEVTYLEGSGPKPRGESLAGASQRCAESV